MTETVAQPLLKLTVYWPRALLIDLTVKVEEPPAMTVLVAGVTLKLLVEVAVRVAALFELTVMVTEEPPFFLTVTAE